MPQNRRSAPKPTKYTKADSGVHRPIMPLSDKNVEKVGGGGHFDHALTIPRKKNTLLVVNPIAPAGKPSFDMDENEQALWQQYDQDRSNIEIRNRLVELHYGLVHHLARHWNRRERDSNKLDDRLSAGALGLIRAVETFDLRREVKFSTYACKCIRGTICNNQVQGRSARSVARRNALVKYMDEPPESEYTPPPPQLDADEVRAAFLCRLQALLSAKQYDMFTLYYDHGWEMGEIASRYQCTRTNVHSTLKRIHDAIKDTPELIELLG